MPYSVRNQRRHGIVVAFEIFASNLFYSFVALLKISSVTVDEVVKV